MTDATESKSVAGGDRDELPVARGDEVTALCSLYESERTDCGLIFATTLGMVGFGLAYIGAVLAFVDDPTNLTPLATAALPLPVVAVACYHSVMVRLNAAHEESGIRLERQLRRVVAKVTDDEVMNRVGLEGTKHILAQNWDPRRGLIRTLASVFAYGTLVVGVIVFMAVSAWDVFVNQAKVLPMLIAAVGLIGCLVLIANWIANIIQAPRS